MSSKLESGTQLSLTSLMPATKAPGSLVLWQCPHIGWRRSSFLDTISLGEARRPGEARGGQERLGEAGMRLGEARGGQGRSGEVRGGQGRLGGCLLVQLCELLEDGGHVGEPLLDLGGGAAPGELGQAPGAGRPVRVDVGDEALARARPRPRHDQLGVVLEVVNLQHETVSRGQDDKVIVAAVCTVRPVWRRPAPGAAWRPGSMVTAGNWRLAQHSTDTGYTITSTTNTASQL